MQGKHFGTALRGAVRIAAAYFVLALLWIFVSDFLVDQAFGGTDWQSRAQNIKGIAFVGVTSVLLFLLIRYELTALRSAREEIAATNRQLDALAAFPRLNPHPVLRLSHDGEVTYANEGARRLVETVGVDNVSALLADYAAGIARRCLDEGETVLDLEHTTAGRTLRWSFFAVAENDSVYGYGKDITEEASLAARLVEAEKMEAVGRLTAGVAHDFNNLLNAVGLYTQVLQSLPEANDTVREYAQSMQAAVDDAAALVRRLLAFGRARKAEPRVVDLNEEVRAFLAMVRHLARPGVSVSFVASDEPIHILADPVQLNQVLINLVVNANDAMEGEGRIEIATATTLDASNQRAATLRVNDTGSGIAPEVLPRIFEPFFTTKADRGTGLGLATVQEIVTQWGGRMEVESIAGRGTTFTVWWPLSPG